MDMKIKSIKSIIFGVDVNCEQYVKANSQTVSLSLKIITSYLTSKGYNKVSNDKKSALYQLVI